jgi:hypothetical protein
VSQQGVVVARLGAEPLAEPAYQRDPKATERGVSGRATALVAAGLLVMSLAAAACIGGEAKTYTYDVWNYSSNHYFVRITFDNQTFGGLAVPPAAAVSEGTTGREPKQADVYDQTCSTKLATLTFPAGVADVVIDSNGAFSVPATRLGEPTSSDPSIGTEDPLPDSCGILLRAGAPSN